MEDPCKNICLLHESMEFCSECFKPIEFVGDWITLTDEEKELVRNECRKNRMKYANKHGKNPHSKNK